MNALRRHSSSFRNDAARWKSAAGRRSGERRRRSGARRRRSGARRWRKRPSGGSSRRRRKSGRSRVEARRAELEAANARNWRRRRRRLARRSTPRGGRRKGAPSSRAVTVTSAGDDGLAAARSEALREASYELERETFAADEARAEARRSRRKAAEAEATAASDDLRAAPAHLRAAKLATRVLCAPRLVAQDELVAALETAGFSCATRGAWTEASPARASNAQVMCVVLPEDSADDASRMDPGTVEEMRAAQRSSVESWFSSRRTRTKPRKGRFKSSSATATGRSRPPDSSSHLRGTFGERYRVAPGGVSRCARRFPRRTSRGDSQPMASSAAKPFDFVGSRGRDGASVHGRHFLTPSA